MLSVLSPNEVSPSIIDAATSLKTPHANHGKEVARDTISNSLVLVIQYPDGTHVVVIQPTLKARFTGKLRNMTSVSRIRVLDGTEHRETWAVDRPTQLVNRIVASSRSRLDYTNLKSLPPWHTAAMTTRGTPWTVADWNRFNNF